MFPLVRPAAPDVSGWPWRVRVLRGRLRSREGRHGAEDVAVTVCLVWVADALVRTAVHAADVRGARALVAEASAVLASVPAPRPLPRPALTGRQLAVLRALQDEASLRQIADSLYVSHNTVKSHSRAVYRKLGVRTRADAVSRAKELGIV
ncbi:helix-turn-helix transcriptional regulator [Streptomyces sp. CRN 30]|uniref:helix-turn-helix transcriptional regulator n=1 Tax=Streptomyces sp. CRN 30 TaxID=3075613 RepID=UPI002A82C7E3|nr:helix-turn-helix transcriptional regulator [Streptomyces sp. CRN 30]